MTRRNISLAVCLVLAVLCCAAATRTKAKIQNPDGCTQVWSVSNNGYMCKMPTEILPSGLAILSTGACPVNTTEDTSYAGRALIGGTPGTNSGSSTATLTQSQGLIAIGVANYLSAPTSINLTPPSRTIRVCVVN